ncbi:hypothetical protein U8607_08350 [Methylobacterium durans]|uniref:Uncharacterized protein n=1 Tax=Methylobacterium durans TaxID=2202825 RepID=A0A2U8W5J8_9HYPH|nr:hypothetical protein [Methylobacterium durans]AWN41394.1 hypothetical protein DK389_13825 [Methylobacterium durans]MEA1832092.1 hypothetical protein [Methylobacterium durans]
MTRTALAIATFLIGTGSPLADEVRYFCAEDAKVALTSQVSSGAAQPESLRFDVELSDETMYVKGGYPGIYRCTTADEGKSKTTYCRSPDRKVVFAINTASRRFSLARVSTEDSAAPFVSTGKCVD